MKELKRNAVIGVLLMLTVILIVVLVSVIGDKKNKSDDEKIPDSTPELSVTPVLDREEQSIIRGIITNMDMSENSLEIMDPETGEKLELYFSGITDVRDRYGNIVTAGYFKIGYIIEAEYSLNGKELYSIAPLTGAWEYKNVRNLWYDSTIGKMTIGDEIYRYNDNLLIISDKSFISLEVLSDTDVINVKGIDNKIYVIFVVKGHGYLALDDEKDFIGGTLFIGSGRTEIITEGMKLMLREGEYEIMIQNGEYTGFKTVKINRNETALFPASEFGPEPVATGRLSFNIEPEGAELFIDGVKTVYTEPVVLSYGQHEIEVALGGYTTYKGSAEVDKTDETVDVILAESAQKDNDVWPDEEDGSSDTDDVPEDENIPDDEDIPEDEYSENDDIDGEDTSYEDEFPDDDSYEDDPYEDDPYEDDPYEDESDEEDPSEEGDPNEDEPSVTQELLPTPTPVEANNRLIIRCTDGTGVYINGVYAGIIENGQLSLDKTAGSISLMLKKDGYITKNYTVFVEEGKEDAVFSFPDMVEGE